MDWNQPAIGDRFLTTLCSIVLHCAQLAAAVGPSMDNAPEACAVSESL